MRYEPSANRTATQVAVVSQLYFTVAEKLAHMRRSAPRLTRGWVDEVDPAARERQRYARVNGCVGCSPRVDQ